MAILMAHHSKKKQELMGLFNGFLTFKGILMAINSFLMASACSSDWFSYRLGAQ